MAPRVHEFPTVKLRRGSPDACQDQVWRGSSKIITFCFGAGPAGGAGRHQIGLAQTSPRARADPRAGGAIARMPAGSFMDYTMPRADDLRATAADRLDNHRDRTASPTTGSRPACAASSLPSWARFARRSGARSGTWCTTVSSPALTSPRQGHPRRRSRPGFAPGHLPLPAKGGPWCLGASR